MSHNNTAFTQLLKLIPRHEFETFAKQPYSGHSFRAATRWSQFVTMAMAQLAGRNSLRDIVENMSAQAHRLYHLFPAAFIIRPVLPLKTCIYKMFCAIRE